MYREKRDGPIRRYSRKDDNMLSHLRSARHTRTRTRTQRSGTRTRSDGSPRKSSTSPSATSLSPSPRILQRRAPRAFSSRRSPGSGLRGWPRERDNMSALSGRSILLRSGGPATVGDRTGAGCSGHFRAAPPAPSLPGEVPEDRLHGAAPESLDLACGCEEFCLPWLSITGRR